jgi:hypothetical protein
MRDRLGSVSARRCDESSPLTHKTESPIIQSRIREETEEQKSGGIQMLSRRSIHQEVGSS